MKKMIALVLMAVGLQVGFAQDDVSVVKLKSVDTTVQTVDLTGPSTEETRYWDYTVMLLEKLQDEGGVVSGEVFQTDPWNHDRDYNNKGYPFADNLVDGQSRSIVNCEVGWYNAYANWQSKDRREEYFYSQGMEDTYLGGGVQFLAFEMRTSSSKLLRLKIPGAVLSTAEEVWFDGNMAWMDGEFWNVYVYEPWNLLDREVEVVWSGHGGWRMRLNLETLAGGTISLNTGKLDSSLVAPTRITAVSFLSDTSYLSEDLIRCYGAPYSDKLGCQVLDMDSLFDGEIKEVFIVLRSYDENLRQGLNYYTYLMKNVSSGFLVPLGNVGFRPNTDIKVYFQDPRTGNWVHKVLWLENGGGKGG